MISLGDVYHVITATLPLYVAMILAYITMKWWKIFTPDQCSGINKFVAKFSVPLLSFQVISSNNLYKMSLKLIYADFVQKFLAFMIMTAVAKISGRGGLKMIITGLSLSTLPNTLILGIPIMRAMYKDEAVVLIAQVVFLQSMVWYNLLLFLYELDAAKSTRPAEPPSQGTGETETAREERSKEEEDTEHRTKRKVKVLPILVTVGKKLIRNPNTFATLIGFIWSSIKFRWGVHMPEVVNQSIEILASGGLGMAMFSLAWQVPNRVLFFLGMKHEGWILSKVDVLCCYLQQGRMQINIVNIIQPLINLGLFMASQSSIIACGARIAMVAIGMKLVLGPALMALASVVIGLRSTLFKVAIVQAALPQGIVPFVFAKEYNVHPAILSTAILLGMLIALPVELAFFFLLEL